MSVDIERKLIYRHEWEAVDDLIAPGHIEIYSTDVVRAPIEIWTKTGQVQELVSLSPEMLAAIKAATP